MMTPHGVCKPNLIDTSVASLGPRARGPLRSKWNSAAICSPLPCLLQSGSLHFAKDLSQAS